jgi:hypothetical protein
MTTDPKKWLSMPPTAAPEQADPSDFAEVPPLLDDDLERAIEAYGKACWNAGFRMQVSESQVERWALRELIRKRIEDAVGPIADAICRRRHAMTDATNVFFVTVDGWQGLVRATTARQARRYLERTHRPSITTRRATAAEIETFAGPRYRLKVQDATERQP